ncbi:phosphotransferase [Rhodobacter sp. 24-YEA-8]|uniref:phosphotransferase n=1 Tax=Rhodobacter sp. 24-YEA-8 TaxID=1884310 RepID=UPI00089579B0|nr:phosphotransferase [Rhodobacter sp. 24-YEA-8]SED75110.1 Ser/Thr protein kinase RdoA involved in Cpx stress response, MazF antagonist [Rhodobacter sp. 24-YEA-8]
MQIPSDLSASLAHGGLPPFRMTTDPALAPDARAADANLLLSQDPPGISITQAEEIALRTFGIAGQFRSLSSERDSNFHVSLACGTQALLKITNASEDRSVTAMQTAALMHLAVIDPDLPVQRICQTLNGEAWDIVTGPSGQQHIVRLLTWLDGTMLHAATPGPDLHYRIGALLGRLSKGMRGFFHPAAGHVLQWDIKQAASLRPMLSAVSDTALRDRLGAHLDRFEAEIAPRLPHLRAWVVHNDFNPHNLVVDGVEANIPTGIIDFGDMVHTPLACDLAVACSYNITEGPAPLARVADMVAGYASVLMPEEEEIALLPDLIRMRHVTTLAVTSWRAARYPENAPYILRNAAASLRGLDAIDHIGADETARLLRAALPAKTTE